MESVHFDHAASTPVDERVLEAMQRWWQENYANPSSRHAAGVAAGVAGVAAGVAGRRLDGKVRASPSKVQCNMISIFYFK